MFIGHFAVGFAAKKFAPKTSLGTLFLSAQFLDLLWPILLIFNFEHVRIEPGNTVLTPLDFYDYPWSHSLLMVLVWAFLFGLTYYRFKKYLRGALAVVVGVLSHWVLDLFVHRPDLPIYPFGEQKYGFGLWDTPVVAIALELVIFIISVWFYVGATDPKDRSGKYGMIFLIALLVAIWAGNFMGPPPPNTTALAIVGNAQWLFVLMGYWVDRHRNITSLS